MMVQNKNRVINPSFMNNAKLKKKIAETISAASQAKESLGFNKEDAHASSLMRVDSNN
jgi:hypothetical protein